MPIEPSLTIRRRLPAPPSLVFQAWTDPDRFGRWFGPPGAELVEAEMEPRAGGRYRILMRAGGEEHGVGGVYREVVPDERLVFTWAWRSTPERELLVTVRLEPVDGQTELTLLHERFFDLPARDRHHEGWTQALDKLAAYLA